MNNTINTLTNFNHIYYKINIWKDDIIQILRFLILLLLRNTKISEHFSFNDKINTKIFKYN